MKTYSRLRVYLSLILALFITTAVLCNPMVASAESGVYVKSVDTVEITVYQGDNPVFPAFVKANMSDNSVKEIPVEWNQRTVYTRWVGTYNYSGKLDSTYDYSGTVSLRLIVEPKVLTVKSSANTIKIEQGSSYTLPEKLPVTMVDGSKAEAPVTWNTSKVDTRNPGIYQVAGNVKGYPKEIKWNLIVNPVAFAVLNQSYELPETLPFIMSDGTRNCAVVKWDSTAQTGKAGSYKYNGTVSGLTQQITLTLNVAGEIASLQTYEWGEEAYQNSDYSLPATVKANIVGGGTADVPVTWTPSAIDLSRTGEYKFTGRVEGYTRSELKLTVNIYPPIVSFTGRPITVPQYGTYILPDAVYPLLADGSYSYPVDNVTWNTDTLDVSKVGEYKIEGTVKGFEQKAYLTVTVVPQFTIDNIRASVKQGETYTLPATVTAKGYDGKLSEVPVVWNATSVDTTKGGTQTFEGTVEGYDGKVILSLFVESAGLVYIADPKLEGAVREELGKATGDILESDMLNLTFLDAKYLHIISLEGLQYAKNLNTLYLTSNDIEDVSQLGGLPNLHDLYINDNNIKNIAPLANIPKLRSLSLGMNQITDMSPLKDLTNLKDLDINRNPLNDISYMKDFKSNLSSLNMYSCKVQDVRSLSVFKGLTSLSLGYNNVSDITPLSSLAYLQDIDLSDNAVEDFSPLSNLTKLTRLDLSGNSIREYSSYTRFNDNIQIDFWGFSQTKAEIASFLNMADEIIASVTTPDMTPVQKEKALHDYVCTNTKYTLGVYKGAYGVLVDKQGACDAISDTMNILLNRAGIECIKVAHAYAGGAHAWNIVKIDGKLYHLDCTWDTIETEDNGTISYTYFNVNDAFLRSEGRTWDTVKYPACE